MAPPASLRWKNDKFMVKVLVPRSISASIYDMDSYQLELSDLPDDLLKRVLERLSSADRVRFGATGKKNLSFVTTQQHHSPHYQFRAIDRLPWMTTFTPGFVDRKMVFSLFEPLQQRGRRPNYADYEVLDPKGEALVCPYHIKACKKGWFLCLWPKEESGMSCFLLFCPFNKRVVKLPDLDHYLDPQNILGDLFSCRATFSSDDPSSPDCVFFFLTQESILGKVSINTLDQRSGMWNTKLFDDIIYVEYVVYHEGCFYCLSPHGELASYDVVQQTWNFIIASSPLFNLHYDIPKIDLVVCEGKLILAFVCLANSDYNNLEVLRCGLLELNSSTSTWVERTSLGDHAIFLGDPTSFCVPVPSWSSVADRMYFYRSRMDTDSPIYYSFRDGRCHMSENGGYWSGVEDGMWIEPPSHILMLFEESIDVACLTRLSKAAVSCTLVVPDFWFLSHLHQAPATMSLSSL